ncbi:MAG: PAS domain-containing protein [Bacteroidales bacterium]|nr:PAS domain-containing protein [Bacteroidales bacterium]
MNRISLLIVSAFIALTGYSQEVVPNEIKVHHLNRELSHNTPSTIYQDSKGFIWFGTFDGLNRYDGLNMVVYKYEGTDTTSLTNSRIQELVEDTVGNIWVATDEGVSRFNRETHTFTRFYNDPNNPHTVPSGNIIDIIVTSKGEIWAVGEEACRYNAKKNNFTRYKFRELNTGEQRSAIYNHLYEDRRGRIWCTYFKEIYYYSPEQDKLVLFYNGYERPLIEKPWHFLEMNQVDDNSFWITTDNAGVIVQNLYRTNNLQTYSYFMNVDNDELINVNLLKLYKDKSQKIWVCAENQGVYVFSPERKMIHRFFADPNQDNTIGFNSVWSIYQDDAGRYWLGEWDAGADVIDPYFSKFEHFQYQKGQNSISNNAVRDILEDNYGNLWIATDGGGLNYFNRSTGEFKVFKHDPEDTTSLSANATLPLSWDNNGNIWIGTWNGGINIFNPETEQFRRLTPANSGLSSLNVFDIAYDGKENMFFATYGGGLCTYNMVTDEWQTYMHDPENINSVSSDYIFSILLDHSNNLWIGCTNALNFLTPAPRGKEEFIHYYHNNNDNSSLSSNSIVTIYEDPLNRIWVGTQAGLNMFNPEEGDFFTYTKEEGMLNDNVNCIVYNTKEDYWIGTNRGLIRFNPVDTSFRAYGLSDGIQGYQYSRGSAIQLKTGEMVFGGTVGFNIFNPDSVFDNPHKPKVLITDFKIFNKSVPIGKNSVLKKHISETSYIKLSYKQAVFTFNFIALNYTHPEQNQYAYIMEGFEDDWNEVGNQTNATYTNLSAGEYVFRIKASNNDGLWNEEGASITIKITPPFWKTWWFISIIVLLVIYAVYLFIKYREKQAEKDKQILEQKIKEGEAIVEKQKQEVENQKEEIRQREEREKAIRFQTTGLAKFSAILSENKDDYEKLWSVVITELVKYVEANQGVIYILNDDSEDVTEHYLKLEGAYACDAKRLKQRIFKLDEGYVGACFKDGHVIEVDNVPATYTKISSGLGAKPPTYLILVPVIQDEIKNGVIEMAAFIKLEPYKVEFLNLISKNICSYIAIMKSTEKSRMAVERSNMQAEELQAQEEELRQNLEEMKTTQDDLQRQLAHNKKMEEEIKIEKGLLDSLLENLPDYIYFKDINSKFIKISKSMLPLFPVDTLKEMIGKSDFDFHPKEKAQEFYNEEQKIIKTQNAIVDKIDYQVTENGVEQWVSVTKMPLYDASGNCVGTFGITKDVTDIKKLEIKATEKAKELKDIKKKYDELKKKLDKK